MKVMVVDGGARGHALAHSYLRGLGVEEVLVAPGNDGMRYDFINGAVEGEIPIKINPKAKLKDPNSILLAAQEYKPDVIEVAQDDALCAGTVNLLESNGFKGRVFGPTKAAAQIEWDKAWGRDFMDRHGISHPEYRVFDLGDTDSVSYAEELIKRKGVAFFKASGLAAGKGVFSARNTAEVVSAIRKMENIGDAGKRFLVEEGMKGEEFSGYALCDGNRYILLPFAQDNKRLLNGDQGPNTGGMGCHSPSLATKGLEDRVMYEIFAPTFHGLRAEGRPFRGILYLGGMLCEDGSIKVVEFNARWGDPEAQVVVPSLGKDYCSLVLSVLGPNGISQTEKNQLGDGKTRVCLVGCAPGYPENPIKGKRIHIDYESFDVDGITLFSAGVKVREGKMYSDGGRVLNVVAQGKDIIEARTRALQAMACIHVDGGLHYRTDIGYRDVDRLLVGRN